jgi:hypothetical protein
MMVEQGGLDVEGIENITGEARQRVVEMIEEE